MRGRRRLLTGALLTVAAVSGACAEGARPELTEVTLAPTSSTTTLAPTSTTTEAPVVHPPAPDGRVYPAVPADPIAAAERLYEIERRIHSEDPETIGARAWADLAHEQQMLYRIIGRNAEWIRTTLADAPDEYLTIIERHLAARQAIGDIGHGGDPPVNVPAWEIVEPLDADELRALYESAEASTGIPWSFLAAINLIETGFGRIDGLSTAGAQGPMQFLPTTWEEVSDGDIDDPHDAIPAAARYLVRRGGPDDMHNALFGYNNSDAYVAAVTHYANLFRDDPSSFLAAHAWEIHYSAAIGDLWFPVGYRREEAQPVTDYLDEAPWSAPPPAA
ncbi:MAG: lytic transglycosylase domain-containing protein [Acidimicrobiales bacterium]